MASSRKKRDITPYPDTSSLDSFPILDEDPNSIDSNDIVRRAAKKRKIEESNDPRPYSIFNNSQNSSGDSVALDSFDSSHPHPQTVTITIVDTVSLHEEPNTKSKSTISRSNTASQDLLSDPSFSFPPGPIREDSAPIILVYEIDEED